MLASAVKVKVDVEVPGTVKLVEDSARVNCAESTELARDPLPTKSPNGIIEMVELLDDPTETTVSENGSAESVKPAPVTVTVMST